jgi:hypothetical protein
MEGGHKVISKQIIRYTVKPQTKPLREVVGKVASKYRYSRLDTTKSDRNSWIQNELASTER